ncbi:hypothetical protein ASG85_10090 [Paenibacillus sp. Soil724D2]|nr:hypothetical protein ASG85_10090 [Paenibacillus sp. Soil724D2]
MISNNKLSYDTTSGTKGSRQIHSSEGDLMNPVAGLDIAKGESQGQPYGKSFTVYHTQEGLKAFH